MVRAGLVIDDGGSAKNLQQLIKLLEETKKAALDAQGALKFSPATGPIANGTQQAARSLFRLREASTMSGAALTKLQGPLRSMAFHAAGIPGPVGKITTTLLSLGVGSVAVTGFLAGFAAMSAVLEFFKRKAQEAREELQLMLKQEERLTGEALQRANVVAGQARTGLLSALSPNAQFALQLEEIERQRTQVERLLAREFGGRIAPAARPLFTAHDLQVYDNLIEALRQLRQAEADVRQQFSLTSEKELREREFKLATQMEEARRELQRESAELYRAAWQESFATIQGLSASFLQDLRNEGVGAFAGLAENILSIWENLLTRMAATKLAHLLIGVFGPVQAAENSAIPVMESHLGGVVGRDGRRRYVDPFVFVGAPRMHRGGIAADEVPTILQKGETVLPRGARAGGEIAVHVDQHFNAMAMDQRGLDALFLRHRGAIAQAVLMVARNSHAFKLALRS